MEATEDAAQRGLAYCWVGGLPEARRTETRPSKPERDRRQGTRDHHPGLWKQSPRVVTIAEVLQARTGWYLQRDHSRRGGIRVAAKRCHSHRWWEMLLHPVTNKTLFPYHKPPQDLADCMLQVTCPKTAQVPFRHKLQRSANCYSCKRVNAELCTFCWKRWQLSWEILKHSICLLLLPWRKISFLA